MAKRFMDRLKGFSDAVRSLAGVTILVCALGAPSSHGSSKWSCPPSLSVAPLAVKATGIEISGRWALLSVEKEEILIDEGGKVGGCLELSRVHNNSVVMKLHPTGEEREFFFNGVSSIPIPGKEARVEPGDGLMRAVAEHTVVPLSSTVTKIQYPMYSNNNTLPQTIYRNVRGDALFEDFHDLGLGANPRPEDPASEVEGVRIGDNTRDSILGSLGISEGDHLVAINGRFVTSPEQVGRLLKEFSGAPIQIGYTRGDAPAIYSTATMIQEG